MGAVDCQSSQPVLGEGGPVPLMFGAEPTPDRGFADADAIRLVKRGVWSLEQYESWAVEYYQWPVAPYCDFRRYTKCCPIVVREKEIQQASRCIAAPCYKRRKGKAVAVLQAQCVGTDADFDDLCQAFRELTVPCVFVAGHGSARSRVKAKASSCLQHDSQVLRSSGFRS